VMVNASDVYAMGGRPVAVVDAVWSKGALTAAPVLRGLADAAAIYDIPVVGGHSNLRAPSGQLAVAILGRAKALLTSFDARPGDVLIAAIDLRGAFRGDTPYWDASTGRQPAALRAALEVLPMLAENGLCRAAKDISMAGVIGTATMLAEASGIGMSICLENIPSPPGVTPARWLTAFPSYGFLLAAHGGDVAKLLAAFAGVGVAAAAVGMCDDTRHVVLRHGEEEDIFWDFTRGPFMNVPGANA
jgi:AIR synthase-related protein